MFDETPHNGEANEEPDDFEPDTSTIAFLDQQQAEFAGMEDEFEATYGFKHECHCGEDYAAGRVGEITQCYHNMMQEALSTCARLNVELKEMTGIAQALLIELKDNIEGEETAGETPEGSAGEVPDEPIDEDTGGVSVDSESSPGEVASDGDIAIGDASGEGLGSARHEVRTSDETGTEFFQKEGRDDGDPGDKKLV